MASEKVDRFVQLLAPSAIEIGAKYGLDPALIISQGALETGWGDSVAGNNYFGVKSHGQPGGNTVWTQEEVNGKMVPVKDSFRAYDGVVQSMEDYAKFLRDNPRYSDVFKQQGVENQIRAVADAGYATDSDYRDKLTAVSRMFDLSPYLNREAESPALAYAGGLPKIGPTGGPALDAINRAAPPMPTAPSQRPAAKGNGFWSPVASLMGAKIPSFPSMQPQQKQSLMNVAMSSLPVRTAFVKSLMHQNIGQAPTVSSGPQPGSTQAMAVSGGNATPVSLMSAWRPGSDDYGTNPANQDKNIYRANAAALGPGAWTQSTINNALSQGKTLYKPV